MLIGHFYIFFREMSIQLLCPFLSRVVLFSVVVPHVILSQKACGNLRFVRNSLARRRRESGRLLSNKMMKFTAEITF